MVLSDKGGSLCVKDVFAKKFFGAGEIPLARARISSSSAQADRLRHDAERERRRTAQS